MCDPTPPSPTMRMEELVMRSIPVMVGGGDDEEVDEEEDVVVDEK